MEIKRLTLQTRDVDEMCKFYVKILGFPLLSQDEKHFRIKIGLSELTFTSEKVIGHPFYHFAFNIPSNQFRDAKAWLKDKTALLLEDGEDEADFPHLPAHACYFEDPAGNIVELIARYHVNPNSETSFTTNSIYNISEIGLVVKDAPEVGNKMNEYGLYERDNDPISNSTLSFMHDRSKGVFVLLTGIGRRWLFSEKKSKLFPLEITLDNGLTLGVNKDLQFFIGEGIR